MSLWCDRDEINFHRATQALSKLRQTPHEEIDYRVASEACSSPSGHFLRFEDERQLVDHIAFLAHNSEGFAAISAVCIEQNADSQGLVLRLAQNKLECDARVNGLRRLLEMVEDFAGKGMCSTIRDLPETHISGMNETATQERMFCQVLEISESRILERLAPYWFPAPAHWTEQQKKKRSSLLHRIRAFVYPSLVTTEHSAIRADLTFIVDALQLLESPSVGSTLRDYVKAVVLCCAEIPTAAKKTSLEQTLGPLFARLSDAGRKAVAQIDKLGRYFTVCQDIVGLVARKRYRRLFRKIHLQTIPSPGPIWPKGTSGCCYVHAEVQLILHYEQYPCEPRPRVIGCSKSACFLCDLFIQYHGKLNFFFPSAHLSKVDDSERGLDENTTKQESPNFGPCLKPLLCDGA